MRWIVREACGGAEAMMHLDQEAAEAMVLDSALPDLEVNEFARSVRMQHPAIEVLRVDAPADGGSRSPRRHELLHALRRSQEVLMSGEAAVGGEVRESKPVLETLSIHDEIRDQRPVETYMASCTPAWSSGQAPVVGESRITPETCEVLLPGLIGTSAAMVKMARMVRLVAPRSTPVLIQGETGTGKELVARALHLLSPRASRPFVVLNCAAIPEALLEAELFGHTRGAFTGAVQARAGRIEAAHGGTLFLDEIGEMPLALQAKMLRFLESGELQRVGENEIMRVDVRIVAATHQPLPQRSAEGTFRLDLYHRLAVFPVTIPPLRDRMEDVLPLASHVLGRLGEEAPVKRLSQGAARHLMEHFWPGNVRELAHVLERGTILAEDRREIALEEICL